MVYLYDLIFLTFTLLVWPISVAFGWYQWIRAARETSILPKFSLAGHVFATLSLILAIGSIFVSDTIGGFHHWDAALLKIYRAGLMLSAVAVILTIAGAWKTSPMRWTAPVAALGAMIFWFASASSE